MRAISPPQVAIYADITGRGSLWASFTEDEQKHFCYLAAVAFSIYEKGSLSGVVDERLDAALAYQALFVAKNFEMYEAAEKVSILTQSSYSDGVLSISQPRANMLCSEAKLLIDEVISELNISRHEVYRG